MKKILALTLAVVMLFCLAACGDGSNDTTTAPTTEATTAPTTEPTTEATTEATETTEDPALDTTEFDVDVTEPLSTEISISVDPDLARAMGSDDGTVYTNEMYGITFTLPEGWVFASEAELATLAGLTEAVYDGTVVGGLIESGASPTVMSAMNGLGLPNVNMNITKDETIDFNNMNDYITMTAEIMPALLESSGMTVSDLETKNVTIAGEERLCIVYNLEFSGVTMSQLICYLAGEGGYLGTLTVTTSTMEEIDTVVAAFAAIG